MNSNARMAKESPYRQGTDESISYQVVTTEWGGSPTAVSVAIYTGDSSHTAITGAALTAIMPSMATSVTGDVISLSPLKSLTPGNAYRVEVKFTSGGDVMEMWFLVVGEQ